jgi:hypothetical protein
MTPISAAGCYAAFGTTSAGKDTADAHTAVLRVDFCHRRVATIFFEAARTDASDVATVPTVLAVVLKRNGSLAWAISHYESNHPTGPVPVDIVKREKAGQTTLDSATDIDGSSLALAGSHLYWLRGGAPVHDELR